jgi:hypothetical protein
MSIILLLPSSLQMVALNYPASIRGKSRFSLDPRGARRKDLGQFEVRDGETWFDRRL